MDLGRLLLEFSQVSNIIQRICVQKKFFAIELKNDFNIAQSTLYRYLDDWCDSGFLEKQKTKKSQGKYARIEYRITSLGISFFTEFLIKALEVLETNNIKYIEGLGSEMIE